MILSELPPKYWANVLLQNRQISCLHYLPILQFGCFQLFPSISPVVFANGWEMRRMTKSDYFYSYNQQIMQENEPQMFIQLSIKGQSSLKDKVDMERWALGIRRQTIQGHSLLGRGHRTVIWGILHSRYIQRWKESSFLVTVGKTLRSA